MGRRKRLGSGFNALLIEEKPKEFGQLALQFLERIGISILPSG